MTSFHSNPEFTALPLATKVRQRIYTRQRVHGTNCDYENPPARVDH
jgi:hypothetical protein